MHVGMATAIGVRAAPPGVRTFEVRGKFLGHLPERQVS
jgi:hypothetical protein